MHERERVRIIEKKIVELSNEKFLCYSNTRHVQRDSKSKCCVTIAATTTAAAKGNERTPGVNISNYAISFLFQISDFFFFQLKKII